ncbi:hypothetical protein GUJ93_ZPchr0011g27444 [Zizania palustris]|uniref:Uncharacterized protein n=1 Tax=Zizania palustris TaxID=103762 RepID=A0A8J5WL48_ZIZPA|nr:hypothetical protein GUJ93_ZPchr0011g27444 [Zizania palustris]
MQRSWKEWEQGIVFSLSSASKSSRHTAHSACLASDAFISGRARTASPPLRWSGQLLGEATHVVDGAVRDDEARVDAAEPLDEICDALQFATLGQAYRAQLHGTGRGPTLPRWIRNRNPSSCRIELSSSVEALHIDRVRGMGIDRAPNSPRRLEGGIMFSGAIVWSVVSILSSIGQDGFGFFVGCDEV